MGGVSHGKRDLDRLTPLPLSFYTPSALVVARSLPGARLVRVLPSSALVIAFSSSTTSNCLAIVPPPNFGNIAIGTMI